MACSNEETLTGSKGAVIAEGPEASNKFDGELVTRPLNGPDRGNIHFVSCDEREIWTSTPHVREGSYNHFWNGYYHGDLQRRGLPGKRISRRGKAVEHCTAKGEGTGLPDRACAGPTEVSTEGVL